MPENAQTLSLQCNLKGICFSGSFSLCTQYIKQQTVTVEPTSAKSTDARSLFGRRLNWTRQNRYLQIKMTAFLPGFSWGSQGPWREVNYTSHLEFLEYHKRERYVLSLFLVLLLKTRMSLRTGHYAGWASQCPDAGVRAGRAAAARAHLHFTVRKPRSEMLCAWLRVI